MASFLGSRAGKNMAGGAAAILSDVDRHRAVYNQILEEFADVKDEIAVLDGSLRSGTILTTQQDIKWNVRSDQPNPGQAAIRTSDKRLDIRDAFVITDITIMIGIELVTGAELPGAIRLRTYPDLAALAVGGFGALARPLYEIYNGELSMMVNTVNYMDGIDGMSFYRVDTAQSTATTIPYISQWDHYKSLTPCVCLSGSDKAMFTHSLPDPTNFVTPEVTVRAVAELVCRGWRIQNGAAYV